ncbi:hypothetical protein NS263_01585 [Curtobacterium oceanosedimentum]|uniref:Uncharacterized protein n=1 Tax=Curtobacterium oceanosedimentum TaxID=465820 RepID=A0ABR5SA17_9MICO|nr:hypothetical protein [Curtobacterium oceanosedimentum]KTR42746.1 hypothetical protein NS263_01585 [Curtobacterium oceanosedimentum]
MITDEPDDLFKRRLDMMERIYRSLCAHPHYGPLMVQQNEAELIEDLRQEWRERQERARARKGHDLREDASLSEG